MRKADNLPPLCAVVTKSGKLNFLEPTGAVQACNGTALLLPFTSNTVLSYTRIAHGKDDYRGRERRLRVFENGVLRRIFVPRRCEVKGEWSKLSNEELNDLY